MVIELPLLSGFYGQYNSLEVCLKWHSEEILRDLNVFFVNVAYFA